MRDQMNIKTKYLIGGLLILIGILIFGYMQLDCFGSVESVPEGGDDVTLLYVQTAHSGTLSAPGSDNIRTLTLNDVSPTTVFFSDRPDRITGHESTNEFVEEWGDGYNSFLDNPPNAALDILGDDSQSVIILELIDPSYDAETRTLQYDVIILEEDTGISEYGKQLDLSILQSFGEAALFIDSLYRNYHCHCEPDLENDCTCEYSYKLGKSSSKEFRGYCGARNSVPESIRTFRTRTDTSCIGDNYVVDDYATRTCTNWSPAHNDKIRVITTCVYSSPGTQPDIV